jgi:hypothetical protein
MLAFERRLSISMTEHLDPTAQDQVVGFIARSLRRMPGHLRLPIVCVSVFLETRTRLSARGGSGEGDLLRHLEVSRLGPIRQYARLMRSLALFAEHEVRPELIA